MKSLRARSWACLQLGLVVAALVAVVPGATPARAVTVADLYEVSVPVTTSRDAAFVDALKTVVIRVSGRRDAPVRLGGALNNPRQYVQRFGFTADNVLQAGFDSVSIDRLLSDAGLPVWGRERPTTLILLNVAGADGASQWIDSSVASAERETITRTAMQRGLPIIWPDLTTQDRVQIDTGDSADTAGLLQIAARYSANAVLLGSTRADGVRWLLVSDGENANLTGSVDDGVHLAADTFARVYAATGSTLDSVVVEVSGMNNLSAYATTLNYLEGMTLVRRVSVEQLSGDTVSFRLAIRGDANTLRRAFALDGKLVPVAQTEASPPADRLQLRFQP